MIYLILKSYLVILLSIGFGALSLFIVGLYFIFKKNDKAKSMEACHDLSHLAKADLSAIAGDDLITTQLDLARAYLEVGKKQSAKAILDMVLTQGSLEQQQEAKHLLTSVLSG
jgi:FimV-like protein